MQQQKQHEASGDPKSERKDHKPNEALANAAAQGKDLLKRLDQASKKRSGHWEYCCGVKTWVPD